MKERKDTINKIMGEILEDMTKASRDKIEKYSVPVEDMEDEEETQTLEEARERGDWLFIFEAARETHLMPGITDDPVLIYERQEQEKEVLSRLKHTYGDFNKWITLFGGLSRGSWIWRGWLFGVISWKWEFSFQMCICGRCVVVMRRDCCVE